ERWGRFAQNVHAILQSSRHQGILKAADRKQKMSLILQQCDEEIRERGCPRTISLCQFIFGTLVQRNLVELEFKEGYYPLITSELESRFPRTSLVSIRFRVTE